MQQSDDAISDTERASDSRADAAAAVVLVIIAVVTMMYWLGGQ